MTLLSLGGVASAQVLFPHWAGHPALAWLRVHLANGLLRKRHLRPSHRRLGAAQTVSPDQRNEPVMNAQPGQDALQAALMAQADRAARIIPPLWPLSASVAVNPFLGLAGETLPGAAGRLGRAGGIPVTMPRSFYRERWRAGEITLADLALAVADDSDAPGLAAVEAALMEDPAPAAAIPTVAALNAVVMADRIGAWASGHFDHGQTMWPKTVATGAYESWRAFATQNLSPEIAGLQGLLPAHLAGAVGSSGGDPACLPHAGPAEGRGRELFHIAADRARWLGAIWSPSAVADGARRRHRRDHHRPAGDRAFLRGGPAGVITSEIAGTWRQVIDAHAAPVDSSTAQFIEALLQEAYDRAAQRRFFAAWRPAVSQKKPPARSSVQAAFFASTSAPRSSVAHWSHWIRAWRRWASPASSASASRIAGSAPSVAKRGCRFS